MDNEPTALYDTSNKVLLAVQIAMVGAGAIMTVMRIRETIKVRKAIEALETSLVDSGEFVLAEPVTK